jgi:hypothetical protein
MALRDKLRDRMQPFLEPGEQVHQTFLVQSGPNPWWMMLTSFILFATKWHVVAVTDRAIVVARSPWYMSTKPKEVTARVARTTQLGPVSGLWGGPLYLTPDGKKSWVHKRFHKDVEAADRALQASGSQPAYYAQQQRTA